MIHKNYQLRAGLGSYSFKVVLYGRKLKDEMFLTLFAEEVHMIFNTPLTKVSTEPTTDNEALKPNHILFGPAENDSSSQIYMVDFRSQCRNTPTLANLYWKRWMKEYPQSLTKRNKWCQDSNPLTTDDAVLIVIETASREK